MDNLVLCPVPLDDLVARIREVVKQELAAGHQNKGDEKLLSPAEACKLFAPAISKMTLTRWTSEGLIPMQKIGGRVWYKHSDVIAAGSKLKRYTATRQNFNPNI